MNKPSAAQIQDLITASRCLECIIPSGMVQYTILAALIDRIAFLPVPEDPQELIAEAACLRCIPEGLLPYAIVHLANYIPRW